ncbi:hypothetical protein QA612_08500 [Evansella sp. AB-P1]|uniref:hypothetical protein n=1 Tax=Evansella sp. AB-P1 TaxID=3037653 RepID=UPI00241CFCA4|nr:hypothetical protein [Evansella sp. AB-P1]MDG5787533.1 hypothetical protein [Evansella sp. AB-P1]
MKWKIAVLTGLLIVCIGIWTIVINLINVETQEKKISLNLLDKKERLVISDFVLVERFIMDDVIHVYEKDDQEETNVKSITEVLSEPMIRDGLFIGDGISIDVLLEYYKNNN